MKQAKWRRQMRTFILVWGQNKIDSMMLHPMLIKENSQQYNTHNQSEIIDNKNDLDNNSQNQSFAKKSKYGITPIKRTFDAKEGRLVNKNASQPRFRPQGKIESLRKIQNYSKASSDNYDQPWFSYEFGAPDHSNYRILKNNPKKDSKSKKRTVKQKKDGEENYDTLDNGNAIFKL